MDEQSYNQKIGEDPVPTVLAPWLPPLSLTTLAGIVPTHGGGGVDLPVPGFARVSNRTLPFPFVQGLVRAFTAVPKEPVSVQGLCYQGAGAQVGSRRANAWSPSLARVLWPWVRSVLPPEWLTVGRQMTDLDPTDWWQGGEGNRWRPVGVTPLLRFMRYDRGGTHYAHYDAGYLYPEGGRRSLLSMVIYLQGDSDVGGETRFIRDGQDAVPVQARDHNDWSRAATSDEVLAVSPIVEGRILLFDHRLCHDASPYLGINSRVIIRGDIAFSPVSES